MNPLPEQYRELRDVVVKQRFNHLVNFKKLPEFVVENIAQWLLEVGLSHEKGVTVHGSYLLQMSEHISKGETETDIASFLVLTKVYSMDHVFPVRYANFVSVASFPSVIYAS